MEQEHGTDAAAICKGVLLRVGMAAAMATAVLGFLSYHVLPRLRKTDYLRMVSDADAQTALTLAPLVLLAICCLCVYPLIGHGKRSRADVVVAMSRRQRRRAFWGNVLLCVLCVAAMVLVGVLVGGMGGSV